MYRIYDFERGKWADDAVVLPNGDIQITKRNKWLGISSVKQYSYSEYQYSVDMDTGFSDKDNESIYENDIIKVGNVTGLVFWDIYSGEYILLDFDGKTHYPLWQNLCNKCALIIGNIEENPTMLPKDIGEFDIDAGNIGDWGKILL